MRPLQLELVPRGGAKREPEAWSSVREWAVRQRELLASFRGVPEVDALCARLDLGDQAGLTVDELIEAGTRAINLRRVLGEGGQR